MVDIKQFGGANLFKWDKDYLFRVLTSGKTPPISDPKLAMAFRQIDRKDFVPEKLQDSAYMDVDLDIGFGERFTRPTVLAQMASLLVLRPGGNYLDIGTGSGFFACIMGFMAGPEGHVYSLERVQLIWERARSNYVKYKEMLKNIDFLYRDGMEGLPQKAPFNAIHVSFAMDSVPQHLKMQLSQEGGKMVLPTKDNDLRLITRVDRENYEEEIIPGFIFNPGKEGLA